MHCTDQFQPPILRTIEAFDKIQRFMIIYWVQQEKRLREMDQRSRSTGSAKRIAIYSLEL